MYKQGCIGNKKICCGEQDEEAIVNKQSALECNLDHNL